MPWPDVDGGVVERIELEQLAEGTFLVRLIDGKGESSYRVTVNPEHYNRLTGGKIPQEELVRRSFQFLLKHEPKESILDEFDLQVIGRYFPEYEREIRRML
jgi:hypothetical protein